MKTIFSARELLRAVPNQNRGIETKFHLRIPCYDENGHNFITIVISREQVVNGSGFPVLPFWHQDCQLPSQDGRDIIRQLGIDLGLYHQLVGEPKVDFCCYFDDPSRDTNFPGEAELHIVSPRQASHALVRLRLGSIESPYSTEDVAALGAERRHSAVCPSGDVMSCEYWLFPLSSDRYPNFWELRWRLGAVWDKYEAEAGSAGRNFMTNRLAIRQEFEKLRPEYEAAGWHMAFDLNSVEVTIPCASDGHVYIVPFLYNKEGLKLLEGMFYRASQDGKLTNEVPSELYGDAFRLTAYYHDYERIAYGYSSQYYDVRHL